MSCTEKDKLNKMKFRGKNSLSFKLIMWVSIVTTVAIGGLTYLNLQRKKKYLMEEVTSRIEQLSEVIVRSLWYDMLHNYRDALYYSIQVIGEQEGIMRVRMFNKEGIITYSSNVKEIGQRVDMKAEACYTCHDKDKPLERLDLPKRTRIFETSQGRVYGMITPIYNHPSCWRAPCHAHPPEKTVLGVLDVVLSLQKTDERIKRLFYATILWAITSVAAISVIITFFLRKYVYTPTKKLLEGTKRIAQGDFDYFIPVTSRDELGELTLNFNVMVEKLKKSNEELKEIHMQLLQTEKLAALGKLAASIAHEINNPLSGVFTYIKLIQKKISHGENQLYTKFSQYLSIMEREVERCSTIVKNLLDFARKREPTLKEGVDVNEVIEETIRLISNRLSLENIFLEKDVGEVPPIVADPAQLRQAFLNLLINATEAMQNSKGRITVRTRYLTDEKMVMVEISDTGVGIKEEDLSKIFDPFFTTKERGTGLGLSVVYGIINAHKGHISVKSKVGEGTTFTIKLPLEFNEA